MSSMSLKISVARSEVFPQDPDGVFWIGGNAKSRGKDKGFLKFLDSFLLIDFGFEIVFCSSILIFVGPAFGIGKEPKSRFLHWKRAKIPIWQKKKSGNADTYITAFPLRLYWSTRFLLPNY